MRQQRKPVCVLEELSQKTLRKTIVGRSISSAQLERLDFDNDLLDHLQTQAGLFSTQLCIYNVPSF